MLKDVNAQAQENDVATVYNFDLVLDGGTVNGTNGGSNPIHVRDNANSGSTFNFRPSYVYGDVVRTYFKNLVTEYDPNSGTSVSYYPGGDLTAFPSVVRKLQVPFVLNYERGTGTNPSSTAVKRQWIQQNVAGLHRTRELQGVHERVVVHAPLEPARLELRDREDRRVHRRARRRSRSRRCLPRD